MEGWIHHLVWLYPLIVSITPLPLDLYDNNILFCFCFGSYSQESKDNLLYCNEA